MSNQAHSAYLESRILTADPLELIRLMYQAAISEVRKARLHLANRDIRSRSQAISKACAIFSRIDASIFGPQSRRRIRRDLGGFIRIT